MVARILCLIIALGAGSAGAIEGAQLTRLRALLMRPPPGCASGGVATPPPPRDPFDGIRARPDCRVDMPVLLRIVTGRDSVFEDTEPEADSARAHERPRAAWLLSFACGDAGRALLIPALDAASRRVREATLRELKWMAEDKRKAGTPGWSGPLSAPPQIVEVRQAVARERHADVELLRRAFSEPEAFQSAPFRAAHRRGLADVGCEIITSDIPPALVAAPERQELIAVLRQAPVALAVQTPRRRPACPPVAAWLARLEAAPLRGSP